MSELFKKCLGDKFKDLAPLVRQAHVGNTRLEGDVVVERGNMIARLICNVLGMPPATAKCRLVVIGHHDTKRMNWNRHFDDHVMNSYFYQDGEYLVERLGPMHMKMALDVIDGVLTYSLIKTKVFGIPVPAFISPRVSAVEQQHEDEYRFSVSVVIPLVGKLIAYSGDLKVETVVK